MPKTVFQYTATSRNLHISIYFNLDQFRFDFQNNSNRFNFQMNEFLIFSIWIKINFNLILTKLPHACRWLRGRRRWLRRRTRSRSSTTTRSTPTRWARPSASRWFFSCTASFRKLISHAIFATIAYFLEAEPTITHKVRSACFARFTFLMWNTGRLHSLGVSHAKIKSGLRRFVLLQFGSVDCARKILIRKNVPAT